MPLSVFLPAFSYESQLLVQSEPKFGTLLLNVLGGVYKDESMITRYVMKKCPNCYWFC